MNDNYIHSDIDGVAVIGMAGQFPGAPNVFKLWENLCNGTESITFFEDNELDSEVTETLRNDPLYVKARGVLQDIDMFDSGFFRMNALESEITDPQNRLFLQTSWHALENAGYDPDVYDGLIGVFAGKGNSTYYLKNVLSRPDKIAGIGEFQAQIANEKDYLSTRVSYKLNLKGPSVSLYTACSTSLVAISYACESLLNYQCDMALAGGVSITTPQNSGYQYKEVNIFSKNGHCRPFDAKATGTVSGNGVAIVVLKRLEEAIQDNDLIYGVIRGTAVNNDGADKMSFMAPSADGQTNVLSMALANSGLKPSDISYVEAHGTGTTIGDPIEFEALNRVYGKGNNCGIGSVKSNLGHLDTAAGVTGLIKTILSLYYEKIPPSLNYESPNPQINLLDSPFFITDKLSQWSMDLKKPRRAGISSFGVGGTNCHVVVEEAPERNISGPSRPVKLLTLSARTQVSLDGAVRELSCFFEENSSLKLSDVAYTLQKCRKAYNHRQAFICSDLPEALSVIKKDASISGVAEGGKSGVVFLFPGQGSHYVKMGQTLYESEVVFKESVDLCSGILEPLLGLDIRTIIYPDDDNQVSATEKLKQTCFNQPAIFVIEYSLSMLLKSWGVKPDAMIGHSIGEYVAATLAGVFTLQDALKLVAARGQLMQEMPTGNMLSVAASKEAILESLPESISFAAENAPQFCVVSGENDDIDQYKNQLDHAGISSKLLNTSHAFHSKMMEPVVESFGNTISGINLSSPKIPFVSTVTGEWITSSEATDPKYWSKQLREPVLFSKAVQVLCEKQWNSLLEVGPRATLNFLVKQNYDLQIHNVASCFSDTIEGNAEWLSIIRALGSLWVTGIEIDWDAFYQNERRNKCSLPGYCFEKKRHWIDPKPLKNQNLHESKKETIPNELNCFQLTEENENGIQLSSSNKTDNQRCDIKQTLSNIWLSVLPDADQLNDSDNFFELGGHSLLAVQLFSDIKQRIGVDLPLSTLFEVQTFGSMVTLLQKNVGNGEVSTTILTDGDLIPWNAIVGIKPKGNKPPFFCVHGIGGNVLNYVSLAGYVAGDQPFYGLQSRGVDGINEPHKHIEDMALRYIQEIKTIQPVGPYYIGGGSMGGLIAYEMAQQLLKRGETVDFLALIDTYGPAKTAVFFQQNQNWFWRSFAGKFISYLIRNYSLPFRKKCELIIQKTLECFKLKSRTLKVKLYRLFRKPLPHKLRSWYLERHHINVSSHYKTEYYDGKITLFRAIDNKDDPGFDLSNGWEGMASHGLEIREIPGNHFNIVEQSQLGEQLACLLENAVNKNQ